MLERDIMSDTESDKDMNVDEIVENTGFTLIGAGVGALVAGPVGLVVGGILGFMVSVANSQIKDKGSESNEQETNGRADDPGNEESGE